jgi:hypothetical protein
MSGAEALVRHAAIAADKPFAATIAQLPSRFRQKAASGMSMRVHLATTGPEPGNWLISVDESACRVFVGSVLEPDARLYTDSDIGHSIISGMLSVDEALTSRLLDYDGDPGVLQRFRSCFEFGGAP